MDGRSVRKKIVTRRPGAADVSVGNHLLAGLPSSARRRLAGRCEVVELAVGDVLCKQSGRISHVFFPLDSSIALIYAADERSRVDAGLVGSEGVLGVSLLLGVGIAPGSALVQGAGSALRLDAATFSQQLKQSSALEQKLKRYLYVFLRQNLQTSVCSRFHVIEARLARWLLMTRDRASSDEFDLTQEATAYFLGVRRSGVCHAASSLQERKLIRYSRGTVTILDGRGLEATSCTCYAIARQTYVQFMGGPQLRDKG